MNLSTKLQNPILKDPMALLRIWLGIAFIMHSTPGVFNADYMAGFAGFLETIDIPFPEIMAYLSKGGEFLAGVLLILGLFTRFAAGIIIIDMIVATFFAMRGAVFGDYQAEISFTYLLIAVALLLSKATMWSLDQKIGKSSAV